MTELVRKFLREEDGMGTVEIVIIIAVLVSIAIIFRKAIVEWVSKTVASVFGGADAPATVSGSGT